MEVDEAIRLQRRLAPRVERVAPPGFAPRTATGLDVAYATGSNVVAAAVVTVDLATGTEVAAATARRRDRLPVRGRPVAFRELPILLEALGQLAEPPDLLVADGRGIAHPRRFGLASHLGVVTGCPRSAWRRRRSATRCRPARSAARPGRRVPVRARTRELFPAPAAAQAG